MFDSNIWLSHGQKVKFKSEFFKDKTGVIEKYDYITGNYFVIMDSGAVCPFHYSEFEVIKS